ncbi:hypothetical protein BASA83_006287 [Batrachochytrium salamandrivorans]|nr:hypothetical protein BASA83_006287 [Batrachochytrium salamandrivorans]
MKEQYEMMGCLSGAEGFYLLQLLQLRLYFLYGDAIGIAYLLDPRFVGKRRQLSKGRWLTMAQKQSNHNRWVKRKAVYLQYTNFVIKANHNKNRKDFLLPDVGKGNQDYSAVLVG